MPPPFITDASDIQRLDPQQLTLVLRALLTAEAVTAGIALRGVEVALNIYVADGGEDGRISWTDGPASTDFIPNRTTCFQCKASELTATEYANEIHSADGSLKPLVAETLDAGGAYVVFTTQGLNRQQKDERISALRAALARAGKPYAQTCTLCVYDSAQIATWTTLHLSAFVMIAQWNGRNEARALKTFDLWGKYEHLSELPFLPAASRAPILEALTTGLWEERACFRLTGLSGLGKTRTAHQVFVASDALRHSVVYVDASDEPQITSHVAQWCTEQKRAIVVVDNCDNGLHERLAIEVRRSDSRLSLLTLDYHPDAVARPTQSLLLKPLPSAELLEMLRPAYGARLTDLERITAFAQGFPQMAVLLITARINEDQDIGRLSEDALAHRLLWRRGEQPDDQKLALLRACSLFDVFGVEGHVESQLSAIAAIAGQSLDQAYGCLMEFVARGIVDKRGRFAQIVPKPLAMRLASHWWTTTRTTEQLTLLQQMPGGLLDSLCNQVENLDTHPAVSRLTEQLGQPGGLLGTAQEFFSDRGTRLIRSLARVNPRATSRALASAIHPLDRDSVLAIAGKPRRNLVWALEHLCFHADLFEESAWTLLLLAAAENEACGNNATGQFKQLFQTQLSGTAAPPTARLSLIARAFACEREDLDLIAIEALTQAIANYGQSRTVGAEYQGLRTPLEDWHPTTWEELYAYWDNAVDALLTCLNRGVIQRKVARAKLGNSVRQLFLRGRIEKLETVITTVIAATGIYWPEAIESLTIIRQHDLAEAPPHANEAVKRWLTLLSPDAANFADQMRILIVNPPWEHEEDGNGRYIDVSAQKAEEFARRVAEDTTALLAHLEIPLTEGGKQAYTFGKELSLRAQDPHLVLDAVLQRLRELPNPDLRLARGLLAGLHDRSHISWETYIENISNDQHLVTLYILMASTGELQPTHLHTILRLIRLGLITPEATLDLTYGAVLDHLPPEPIIEFCLGLGESTPTGNWPALNLLFSYSHPNRSKIAPVREQALPVILSVPLDSEQPSTSLDPYHWSELAIWALSSPDPAFVTNLTRQLLNACRTGLDYNAILHYYKPMLTRLLKAHATQAWPLVAEAIRDGTPKTTHWIQELLEKENGIGTQHPGPLSVLPPELVIAWCHDNPTIGPMFVARCISIFEEKAGAKTPSPLLIALLSHFGDNQKVAHALSLSLRSRGWSGSLVPYLQADKLAIEPLLQHTNAHVRAWANGTTYDLNQRIAAESTSDNERDLRMN